MYPSNRLQDLVVMHKCIKNMREIVVLLFPLYTKMAIEFSWCSCEKNSITVTK